jgi:hypothetical protein
VKLDTYARARRIATLLGPDWAFAISIPASGASTRICFSRGADRVVLEGSERIAAIGSNLKDLRERMAALLETIRISSGDGREGETPFRLTAAASSPSSSPCDVHRDETQRSECSRTPTERSLRTASHVDRGEVGRAATENLSADSLGMERLGDEPFGS